MKIKGTKYIPQDPSILLGEKRIIVKKTSNNKTVLTEPSGRQEKEEKKWFKFIQEPFRPWSSHRETD